MIGKRLPRCILELLCPKAGSTKLAGGLPCERRAFGDRSSQAERRFCPTARISDALPIFERPSIPSRAASRRSSVTVIAPAPVPVPFVAPRLRAAALAPSLPSAVRVFFGSLAMVLFRRAPAWACLTFLRATWRCFCVAILVSSRWSSASVPGSLISDASGRLRLFLRVRRALGLTGPLVDDCVFRPALLDRVRHGPPVARQSLVLSLVLSARTRTTQFTIGMGPRGWTPWRLPTRTNERRRRQRLLAIWNTQAPWAARRPVQRLSTHYLFGPIP